MRKRDMIGEGLAALALITMPFWVHWIFWLCAGAKPWDAL